MITLYQFGNSVCCQKVRLALAEKDLAWSGIEVNLFKNEQYEPAYLRLNPSGVVPTLVDEGEVVTESTLICEYLDELYPNPPLMPTTALARTQVRRWSKLVDEGLHEGVAEISFSAMFRERMKRMSSEAREARFKNVGDPRRRDRFMSTFELGVQSPYVLHGVAAFERTFKRLESDLEAHGPWLMGDRPTLADIGLIPYVARLHFLNLLTLWTEGRPRVQAWWDLVQHWPSYWTAIMRPMFDHDLTEMAIHGPSIHSDIKQMLGGLRTA